jgi:hypothetical protein
MTSSFSFGFSGDDIEGDEGDIDMDMVLDHETASPGQVLLEPRRHSLEELVGSPFSQYALSRSFGVLKHFLFLLYVQSIYFGLKSFVRRQQKLAINHISNIVYLKPDIHSPLPHILQRIQNTTLPPPSQPQTSRTMLPPPRSLRYPRAAYGRRR